MIDGQQRLSTILCILKFLKLSFPNVPVMKDIPFNWLETRVNNGKEDKNLRSMLELDSLDSIQDEESVVNSYLKNLQIIRETFDELTTDEQGKKISLFNIQEFIDYFLNDIYFVVVETLAGLSKTIQIFIVCRCRGDWNAFREKNGEDRTFFRHCHA